MDINLYEVLLAASVAWGALRVEIVYRRWRARKNARRSKPVAVVGSRRVQSTTIGSVDAMTCSCGHKSNDYMEFTDGTRVCLVCHREGIEAS